MGAIIRKENIRVVVLPRGVGDFGWASVSPSLIYGRGLEAQARIEREEIGRAEEIAKQIKRHVDDVHSADVEFDAAPYCEHCGSHWTEESRTYNGGCCDKDEEANPDG